MRHFGWFSNTVLIWKTFIWAYINWERGFKSELYGIQYISESLFMADNPPELSRLISSPSSRQPLTNSSSSNSPSPLLSSSRKILLARSPAASFQAKKWGDRWQISALSKQKTKMKFFGDIQLLTLGTPSISYKVPMISIISGNSIDPLPSLSYILNAHLKNDRNYRLG